MAIRAFVTQTLDQLKVTLSALEKATQSGSLVELRVAGVLERNAELSPVQLQTKYDQCRFELFLRAQTVLKSDPAYNRCKPICEQVGLAPNTIALLDQYPDPYSEKVMRVETRQRSSFGNLGMGYPQ